jgi:Flp pilus assembly protein TadB
VIRWLAAAAVIALLATWGLWQRGQAIAARGELQILQTDLSAERAARAQSDEAAAVLRAHFARITDEDAQWRDLDADLRKMEGRDAPLSPLLRTTAERLWGQ